jgi:hypothetical protein
MRQIITTYITVVVLLTLGFFGVGALAKAETETPATDIHFNFPAAQDRDHR